jgi:hypothetical protein
MVFVFGEIVITIPDFLGIESVWIPVRKTIISVLLGHNFKFSTYGSWTVWAFHGFKILSIFKIFFLSGPSLANLCHV